MTGTVPAQLGSLSGLTSLSLQDNQLTGELPDSFTGLTLLEQLRFYRNPGLCAPVDNAFQTWFQGIDTVRGSTCAPQDSQEDRAVLATLYNATNGANWEDNSNWLSSRPVREWYGVTNDADGRVIGLYLYSNQLTGSIPPELGNLSNLTGLFPPQQSAHRVHTGWTAGCGVQRLRSSRSPILRTSVARSAHGQARPPQVLRW